MSVLNMSSRKCVNRVLLLLCDTAWMRELIERGWNLTGAEVFCEYYGTTMGRGWDKEGLRVHRDRNAFWRRRAIEIAEKGGLDLVFIIGYDDVLERKTLKAFHDLGAKIALYHVDMPVQWHRILKSAPLCDVVCHAQDDHVGYLQKKGISLYRLPMAANPPPVDFDNERPIPFDGVLYLGSPWIYRQVVIKKLVNHGIPVRVYGHNWDRVKPWPKIPGNLQKTIHDIRYYLLPVMREEGLQRVLGVLKKRLSRDAERPAVSLHEFPQGVIQGSYLQAEFSKLIYGASINLGFTHMNPDWRQEYPREVRLRDFEIPMYGGFHLTQNCPELEQYFEIGKEIAVWDTAEDLIEKCWYYLARPEERAAIAEAGCRRTHAHHTWVKRFAGLVQHLGMHLPSSCAMQYDFTSVSAQRSINSHRVQR